MVTMIDEHTEDYALMTLPWHKHIFSS